jgi:hypothetical protein
MKLKIIYTIMSISLIVNWIMFDTLSKTVAEVNHLQDLNIVQKDYNIELKYEFIDLLSSNRMLQDLGK